MGQKQELENLLKNISEGLKKYSVRELNDAIVSILSKKGSATKEVNIIIETVCDHYSIPRRMLIFGRDQGRAQEAKQIAYCLLHNVLGLTQRHIAIKIFKKTTPIVSRAIKRYYSLNVAIETDREFKSNYDYLQKRITAHIKLENNEEFKAADISE